jgi:thioredoxin reductase
MAWHTQSITQQGRPIVRNFADVAVIGAGPYGLSLAAYLRKQGVDVRVFGSPMETWRDAMPVGMKLKSEGFASNIADPDGAFSLSTFCKEANIPYADTNLLVTLSTFLAYGNAFQKRLVPELEQKMVVLVEPAPHGFNLHFENGEIAAARRTVIASGIRVFAYSPPELVGLPKEVFSHSADFGDAVHLAGREVAVIGAGASAMDVSVLLRSHGAQVTVISRRSVIRFQSPLGERTLYEKIRAPMTGLGPGWKSVLCVRGPLLFHVMPRSFRVDVVRRYLGPAPAWYAREQVEGRIPYILQSNVIEAQTTGQGVRLTLRHSDGSGRHMRVDHVVAATGYRVDTQKLPFLCDQIQARLGRVDGAPALSRNFESTVPGLYFVGTSAANSFGPMLRFVYGTAFASRRVANHIAPVARGRSATFKTAALKTSAS